MRPPPLLWNTVLARLEPYISTWPRVLATAARVEAVSASRPLYTWLVTVALTSKGALGLR